MNLVVVSNRVARGKANEPMTGGLGGRLAAGGGEIRRDLGGFQRPRPRRCPEGTVRRNRGARRRRAGDAGSAGRALRRLLRRFRQFGVVAGAAFALRPDPRLAGGLSLLSRSQRLHGARAAAVPEAGHRVLDPGLSFPGARRGIARSRRHPADRVLPAYALAGARRHRRRAASSRIDRGDAGLRSDRIPDRRTIAKISSAMSSRISASPCEDGVRHLAPRHHAASRYFRSASIRKNSPSRPPRRCRIPTCRGCGAA